MYPLGVGTFIKGPNVTLISGIINNPSSWFYVLKKKNISVHFIILVATTNRNNKFLIFSCVIH